MTTAAYRKVLCETLQQSHKEGLKFCHVLNICVVRCLILVVAGFVLLAILLGTVHYTEDDEDEASKANGWCNFDASCTEDVGIEILFSTAASAHEYES